MLLNTNWTQLLAEDSDLKAHCLFDANVKLRVLVPLQLFFHS